MILSNHECEKQIKNRVSCNLHENLHMFYIVTLSRVTPLSLMEAISPVNKSLSIFHKRNGTMPACFANYSFIDFVYLFIYSFIHLFICLVVY